MRQRVALGRSDGQMRQSRLQRQRGHATTMRRNAPHIIERAQLRQQCSRLRERSRPRHIEPSQRGRIADAGVGQFER